MLKYSLENIDLLFSNFEQKTERINAILAKNDDFDLDEIEKVKDILIERKIVLEKFQEWINFEDKDVTIEEKQKKLKSFADKVLETERKNLELLKNITSEKASKLKELNLNKSVLIYSGKKKYEH